MNRSRKLVAAIVAGQALLVPVDAGAADTGFYLGGQLGRSSYDISSADVAPGSIDVGGLSGGIAVHTVTVAASSLDKSDTTYGLTLGYQFVENFAVEVSYLDLGTATITANGTYTSGTSGQIPFSGKLNMKSRGPTLAVVGVLPFENGWGVDARLGGYFDRTKYDVMLSNPSGTVSDSETHNNTHVMAGVGVFYRFDGGWSVRLDCLHFDKVGDSDVYQTNVNVGALGLQYRL